MKPTLGVFSFTSCSGCQLEIIAHQEDIFLDLVKKVRILHFPIVQQKSDYDELDIAIVEGSISTRKQAEQVQKIREKAKLVIALGACATHGGVNSIRNTANDKSVERKVYGKQCPLPSIKAVGIDKYITVDYYLRGCPPVKEEFTRVFKELLLGLKPFVYNQPVCTECLIKENGCLLKKGELCLGPITVGGCGAICPSNNLVCDGCRGPTEDANLDALQEAMECGGISKSELKRLVSIYNTASVKIK
jgi:sulfhydrogenase subunit delta